MSNNHNMITRSKNKKNNGIDISINDNNDNNDNNNDDNDNNDNKDNKNNNDNKEKHYSNETR